MKTCWILAIFALCQCHLAVECLNKELFDAKYSTGSESKSQFILSLTERKDKGGNGEIFEVELPIKPEFAAKVELEEKSGKEKKTLQMNLKKIESKEMPQSELEIKSLFVKRPLSNEKTKAKVVENFREEIRLMKKFSELDVSPKFIDCFDSYRKEDKDSKGDIFAIMEKMPCSLSDMIDYEDVTRPINYESICSRLFSKLPLETQFLYFKKMVEKLARIHKEGFVHNDVKPENMVIASLTDVDVDYIDFGSMKPANKHTIEGTRAFMHPAKLECITSMKLGIKSLKIEAYKELKKVDPYKFDVWALGVTFYYLLHPASAWIDHTNLSFYHWYEEISDFVERVFESKWIKTWDDKLCHGFFKPPCFSDIMKSMINLKADRIKNIHAILAMFENIHKENFQIIESGRFEVVVPSTENSAVKQAEFRKKIIDKSIQKQKEKEKEKPKIIKEVEITKEEEQEMQELEDEFNGRLFIDDFKELL